MKKDTKTGAKQIRNKYAETEIYVIDFINKSLVFSATVSNKTPDEDTVTHIYDSIEMLMSMKEAREIKVS